MTIFRRPPSLATQRALKRALRYKQPTKEQIAGIAVEEGVHWVTVYRAMKKHRLTNGSRSN